MQHSDHPKQTNMISEKITIQLETGLHARPASQLVTLIKGLNSNILFRNGIKAAKGTSIIGILALGLKYGSELEIISDGGDETTAMETVLRFFECLKEEK